MKNNDFLKEVQKKINKRSGGYYYNSKVKSLKINFYVTVISLFVFVVLFFVIKVLSENSVEKISKTDIKLQKEGVRYVLDLKDHDMVKEYFMKYTVIKKDDTVIYLIPPKKRKELIKLVLRSKIGLKEENYIKKGFFYQFIFK